jgi:WD40 repeat protein
MAFSSDGKYFAAGGGAEDPVATVWELEEGRYVSSFKGHRKDVQDLAFCPNGRSVVTVGLDGTLRMWHVKDGTEIKMLKVGEALSFDFVPDRKQVITGCKDIRLWDFASE